MLRFGVFELDLKVGELRKAGALIKLPPQPFKVLALLVCQAGEVVTREEIQQQVWGGETYVDFERGLNFCIRQIRTALGDDAETPRYIETLPRRGYRLIAPVEELAAASVSESPPLEAPPEPVGRRFRTGALWVAGGVLAVLLAWLLGFRVGARSERQPGPAGPLRIQAVAVLPLENLTRDPAQDYFVDGMTDALITELAQIGALRVISRTSAMRYKGSKKPLPEIAREVKVDAVLEGAVLRSGDRVRITAQLIHAATDTHLWAGSYERDLPDVLALQREVARNVAREIRITLTPRESARLASARQVHPEAYQLYLKGRYSWNERSEEDFRKAIEYFQQAIAMDPNYALPYAGLADCYHSLHIYGHLPPKEAIPKAKAAALQALEMDDTLAEAHASLASVRVHYDWDWADAEKEFRRAIELNPGYVNARYWYASYLAEMGRAEEAVAESVRAQQLDPLSLFQHTHAGVILYLARRYDQVIEVSRSILDLDPNNPEAYYQLGMAYTQKGMHPEAIAAFRKAITFSGGAPGAIAALGYAHAVAGDKGQALKALRELKQLAQRRHISSFDIATIYVGLGEKDQAFQWLEKAYQERHPRMVSLEVEPILEPLQPDPRFQDLLRRVGLPH